MRILVVHNFYQIPGGEDSVVRDEVALLAKHGIDVKLFSADNEDIKGTLGGITTGLRAVYNPSSRRALAKKLFEFQPHVVHVHNFFPLLSPSIFDACRDAGVPSVLTLHNFRILCPTALMHADETLRERSLRHSCWWTVPQKAYRNSLSATLALATMVEFHKRIGTWACKVDRFIALSTFAKRTFTDGGLPAERIVVKPNSVTRPPAFTSTPREGGLFVGRLHEQKGVKVVLQAWQDIDYPLTIIGDGPLSDFVQQSARGRVTYLGRQPREVVRQEMQKARFLVLPSLAQEMFPLTLLEAFSNRLPVMCSNLPSLVELVEPGVSGLTFTPDDAVALATTVKWGLACPLALDTLARQAAAIYEARFTPEANFAQLIAIYRTLLGSGRTRLQSATAFGPSRLLNPRH